MSRRRIEYLAGVDALGARAHLYDEEPANPIDAVAARAIAEMEDPAQLRSSPNADGGRTVDGGGPPIWSPTPPARPRLLKSELDGIADEAWTEFVRAMKVQDPSGISASNEIGMFGMKPRRLADLGLIHNLTGARSPLGRMVWVGEWKKPLTQEKFLASPKAQYAAFNTSMRRYVAGIEDGSIAMPGDDMPEDLTLSGALAVLHRCGPSGLVTWDDVEDRFPATVALVERTNGIF